MYDCLQAGRRGEHAHMLQVLGECATLTSALLSVAVHILLIRQYVGRKRV